MALNGHVDGFKGCYVVGWAHANDPEAGCTVRIEDADGRHVASGKAAALRPDLVKLGPGYFAFQIALGEIREAKTLRATVDGSELPGSPFFVGPGRYDGHIWVANGLLQGWISERLSHFDPPVVRFLDQDGENICEIASEFSAEDTDPFFAPARFKIPLPNACFGRHDVELRAMVNGVQFARTVCSADLRGKLEHISRHRCAGWLTSPDAPQHRFEIDIYRDGALIATAKADRPRSDLQSQFPRQWQSGFDVGLPVGDHFPTELASMSLRLRGSDVELFEGPYVIGEAPATIAVARKAATMALASNELNDAERSIVQSALAEYVGQRRRANESFARPGLGTVNEDPASPRLNIAIPIYRDTAVTRTCIDSVLAHRSAATDRVILINDCSPDADMADMLRRYSRAPNVTVLTNETNLGFVKTVNRALGFCRRGPVLLLNSDTRVFAGAFDELLRVANATPDIATVTAMSNRATIFSYPHPRDTESELGDVSWERLAAIALRENAGSAVDVPTAHGFCMLIKQEALRRVGLFDETFGRGYGEENDFCSRAADIGFRNVAAGGVLVEHRESVSFGDEKNDLRKQNLELIGRMYPEYMALILDFERRDPLRSLRWPLDRARFKFALENGRSFVLVIQHWMGGGTIKAARDIETVGGIEPADKITLTCRQDGSVELVAADPVTRAIFAADEVEPLFALLTAAKPHLVIAHQVVGYSTAFVRRLTNWVRDYRSIFYAHDFYTICPRVTLIDATQQFCNVPSVDVCERCVALGGAHEGSKLGKMSLTEHRDLFADLLAGFTHVVTPSVDASGYLRRVFGHLPIEVVPHPDLEDEFPAARRFGNNDEILLLGAIGPHKGSRKLLELAQRARLTHPRLSFRLIGYTDIDDELSKIGNVIITGKYDQAELPRLVGEAKGRLALFLNNWPETFSYSLSEVVALGFIPLVPDIGAPADRVRAAGFGAIFRFPADVEQILRLIDDIASGRQQPWSDGATPQSFQSPPSSVERIRALLSGTALAFPAADALSGFAVASQSGGR